MTNSLLADWNNEEYLTVENGVLVAKHRLAETGLFTDESLIKILDNHPEDCLTISTMGNDTSKFDWREGNRNGLAGDVLLELIRTGHFWINVRRVLDFQPELAAAVHAIYDDLEENCPGFAAQDRTANLLLSSPNANVPYHVDLPVNMLWHVRGRKRVWVYPHFDNRFVSQTCMELVCSGDFSEDVPYESDFDNYALVFDAEPGQLITWPQHAPHRVLNLDGLNVSLSTEHKNPRARRRINIHLANQFLKRTLGINCKSIGVDGPIAHVKQAIARAVRYTKRFTMSTKEQYTYPKTFVLDPEAPQGVRFTDITNDAILAPHESDEFFVKA